MPDAALLEPWVADLAALSDSSGRGAPSGSSDPAVARRAGAELLTRWREPHRRYHTVQHLTEMLTALDTLGPTVGLADRDSRIARIAAWLHDAVYDVHAPAGAMERESARLGRELLGALCVGTAAIQAVEDLILLTIDHGTQLSGALADTFTDADLAILAAPPERFDGYCTQVRAEYEHVPDAAYMAARSEILAALVDRPQVYRTAFARTRWTADARANVRRELDRLTG